jgi:hypothetical protein
MSTPERPKQQPPRKPDTDGKPTIEPGTHDQNIGQREGTKTGNKPTVDDDNRGKNYGQRNGSTVSEDNDVE